MCASIVPASLRHLSVSPSPLLLPLSRSFLLVLKAPRFCSLCVLVRFLFPLSHYCLLCKIARAARSGLPCSRNPRRLWHSSPSGSAVYFSSKVLTQNPPTPQHLRWQILRTLYYLIISGVCFDRRQDVQPSVCAGPSASHAQRRGVLGSPQEVRAATLCEVRIHPPPVPGDRTVVSGAVHHPSRQVPANPAAVS